MKTVDLTKMSDSELLAREVEFRSELQAGRLRWRLGQFKQTAEFKRLRQEIARIKTQLSKLRREVENKNESAG
ncbi:MAG: 50S ribosomal protein L29 [Bradymonadales bacterium]|nr:MAG: 50S ribosomal protein L29 [Bradymonadales bacterium]